MAVPDMTPKLYFTGILPGHMIFFSFFKFQILVVSLMWPLTKSP